LAEFTGRKMLAVTLGAFGVVVAVNGVLAWQAVATFPGLEVQNGYVASQTWDAERAAQAALGWRLAVDYDPGRGRLRLAFTDRDGRPAARRARGSAPADGAGRRRLRCVRDAGAGKVDGQGRGAGTGRDPVPPAPQPSRGGLNQ
jgi:nitrogen fixation protein FixH